MTVQEHDKMTVALISCYPGKKWQNKVMKMPDEQLTAIYLSFKKRGKVA